MVSHEDVAAAYRMILGREPESGAAIQYHAEKHASVADLCRELRRSEEFQDKFSDDLAGELINERHGAAQFLAAATSNDMILKRISFRIGISGYIALPLLSTDPIVASYAAGQHPNDYLLDILETLTEPGDQVIDLGAHVGSFCVPAALMGRKLLAVDASEHHTNLLRASARVNNLPALAVVNRAITRTPGPVSFSQRGLFGAVDFAQSDAKAVSVAGETLRNLIDQNKFGRTRLIKMDIEGSELFALETIRDLLLQPNGPAIAYESNAESYEHAGYSVKEMRLWLESHGYQTFRAESGRWIYAPPDQPQPELWVDLIALSAKQRRRFANLIDPIWQPAEMRDRFLTWSALPHANTRAHIQKLLNDDKIRALDPSFDDLARSLVATNAK
jgi:FkbM family methyltransferase